MKEITADQLKQEKHKYILLDIREDFERAKDGAIPNSHHLKSSEIDIYNILDFFNKFEEEEIVIYCNSGARSSSLIENLHNNNIYKKDKIINLKGGFQIWKASMYEIEKI